MLARGGTAAGITTAIVMFTRDLRLHDNPALYLACSRARQVVPLFVLPAVRLHVAAGGGELS